MYKLISLHRLKETIRTQDDDPFIFFKSWYARQLNLQMGMTLIQFSVRLGEYLLHDLVICLSIQSKKSGAFCCMNMSTAVLSPTLLSGLIFKEPKEKVT